MINLDPPDTFGLPHQMNVYGRNPWGKGVFIGGGERREREKGGERGRERGRDGIGAMRYGG
jgi:hypothetical protein